MSGWVTVLLRTYLQGALESSVKLELTSFRLYAMQLRRHCSKDFGCLIYPDPSKVNF